MLRAQQSKKYYTLNVTGLSPIFYFIVSIVADQNAAVSAVGAMLLG